MLKRTLQIAVLLTAAATAHAQTVSDPALLKAYEAIKAMGTAVSTAKAVPHKAI